ncbi:MAG TPA: hypothetical protein VK636_20515 [Gemmatimonadaceae bacterium]|nr:hypothetical protein [Gemmatimonadaceae bacterium]
MNRLTPVNRGAFSSWCFMIAAGLALACHHAQAPEAVGFAGAPPTVPQEQLTAPANGSTGATLSPLRRTDSSSEEHVTIDTHGAEMDVRQALSFLASRAGISLIYSPEINKKVRVELVDVPVSDALQSVLSIAGLTIESTTPKAKPPANPAVVFYELPVNVDSLSADAIMKRFGVGRAIADLLVQGRPKP